MDPTRIYCDATIPDPDIFIKEYVNKNIISIRDLQNQSSKSSILVSTFDVMSIIPKVKEKLIESIPDKDIDPILSINPDPFIYKESFNLASIDYHFSITKHVSGSFAPQMARFQSYAIIGAKDISFFEYLQYRNPYTFMYNLSLSLIEDLNNSIVVKERVYDLFNKDYKDYDFYIKNIKKVNCNGVDAVIIENYNSNSELIYQLLINLSILKNEGDSIIKINISNKNFSNDILRMLYVCFGDVYLFKSVMLDIDDDNFYIICKKYNIMNSIEIIKLLKVMLKKFNYGVNVLQLFSNKNEDISKYTEYIENLIIEERNLKNAIYVPQKVKIYLNVDES